MKINKKDQRELHAMLDEALDRVLKGEDINIVLADYPRFAEEFAPLLLTAKASRTAADIKPRPEFRQRAALDFQKAIQAMPVAGTGTQKASRWRLAWIMPVAVFAALLISGTGLVAASNNSLPGNPLYSVKLAAENLQLAFTPSNVGKAELYAKFNDRRVDELVAIAANTDGVELAAEIDTLNTRMVSNMNSISDLTGGANIVVTSGSEYNMFLPDQSESSGNDVINSTIPALTTAATVPPSTATTVTKPTKSSVTTTSTQTETMIGSGTQSSVTASVTTTTQTTTPPKDVPLSPTTLITVPPVTSTGITTTTTESVVPERANGQGNKAHSALTDKEQKLKALLTEKQQKNLEKLEAAWEKAPDWLKPQIRHTIEIILYGYDTSIDNLSD